MSFTDDRAKTKLAKKIFTLVLAILLLPLAAYCYGAAQFPVKADEARIWAEIAYVRFQAAQGYDLQSDIRRQAALKLGEPNNVTTPGNELELAGDEKSLACEEYQKAAQHWEQATQGFRSAVQLEKAKTTKESAAASWLAARQTVLEAIELYRTAEEFYETANDLPKKSAVLGKIATNLERLIDINTNISSNSVS
jgi:hypothetical protein